jgi:hypothetical protein
MGGSYFGALAFKVMGTERMRIDPSGNVGIGTASPGTKLNMKGGVFLAENQASTNNQILYFDGGGTGVNTNSYNRNDAKFGVGIFVNDTGTTGSTITLVNKEGANNVTKHASIGFVNTDTTANGKFGGQIGFWPEDSNASKQQFRIYTSGASAGYNLPVQRMVVTGDGDVGIGTASPGYKLHVSGDINFTGTLYQNGTAFSGGGGSSVWSTSGSDIYYNSGSVGIGTTTFTDTRNTGGLHIQDNRGISFAADSSQSNSRHWRIRPDDYSDWGSLQISVSDNNSTHPDASDEHVMTMTRDRNVGIGTASPDTTLDVAGSINNGTYAVNNGHMANRSLSIGDTASNYGGGTSWNSNTAGFMMECLNNTEIAVHDAGTRIASFMYFEGGTTNRFTIGRNMGWGSISTLALNGNVGIGTNAPSYKLHISAGNDSITWYGPNTTWSSYLAVGAANDKTVANNTTIAQCITTNGNLHLDAGHSRDIYMNYYSGNYIRHNGLGVYSDDRLKTDEELITNATDTLLKLSPQKYLKKYTLRENETREPFTETGLIAQDIWYDAPELRHIVMLGADADPTENKPEAPVDGDIQQDPDYSSWGPNTASVNYDGLIAYLVKSNQELHGEIQALKARITTLENA